jgi:hypothetical protein
LPAKEVWAHFSKCPGGYRALTPDKGPTGRCKYGICPIAIQKIKGVFAGDKARGAGPARKRPRDEGAANEASAKRARGAGGSAAAPSRGPDPAGPGRAEAARGSAPSSGPGTGRSGSAAEAAEAPPGEIDRARRELGLVIDPDDPLRIAVDSVVRSGVEVLNERERLGRVLPLHDYANLRRPHTAKMARNAKGMYAGTRPRGGGGADAGDEAHDSQLLDVALLRPLIEAVCARHGLRPNPAPVTVRATSGAEAPRETRTAPEPSDLERLLQCVASRFVADAADGAYRFSRRRADSAAVRVQLRVGDLRAHFRRSVRTPASSVLAVLGMHLSS